MASMSVGLSPVRPDAFRGPLFRRTKCGIVYKIDANAERSRCSQCGKLNGLIWF